jgi:hypothetical protein
MTGRKLILRFIAAILTVAVIYGLALSIFPKDFATSVEPGWHTTIFPPKAKFSVVTVVIFILLTYLIFKSFLWILVKMFSLQPDGKRTNR